MNKEHLLKETETPLGILSMNPEASKTGIKSEIRQVASSGIPKRRLRLASKLEGGRAFLLEELTVGRKLEKQYCESVMSKSWIRSAPHRFCVISTGTVLTSPCAPHQVVPGAASSLDKTRYSL